MRCVAALAVCAVLPAVAQPRPKPKLVLGIVIDQFRYDYLNRFRSDYTGGFDRFLRRGAVFTNARFQHIPTVTAVGHAIWMTGATPSRSGIVNNEWYDRETRKRVTSVSDATEKRVGGEGAGASPRRLVPSTLGDEMKLAWRGKPRVIGVSLKDRAAILPAGHMADAAYWFSGTSGGFLSSTYYFPELPAWVQQFNAARPDRRYAAAVWKPLVPNPDYPDFSHAMPAADGKDYYTEVGRSPFADLFLEEFVERLLDQERLGQRGVTDLLTVSFSANDVVGHYYGPDSPEIRDIVIRMDRLLAKLLDFIEARLGPDSTLVVFTADHGVMPVPEYLVERKMPGGRVRNADIWKAVETALDARFGEGTWIEHADGISLYLNRDLIAKKNLSQAEVERVAAQAAAAAPHVFRVYTRHQILDGAGPRDRITRAVERGFYPSRSGDLYILLEPYWLNAALETSHGTPYSYDSHVPVVFLGPGIEPGRYDREIAPYDIAPTLATLLDVEIPSGAIGQVLEEVVRPRHQPPAHMADRPVRSNAHGAGSGMDVSR